MIVKFLLLWVLMSLVSGTYVYLLNRGEKKVLHKISRAVAVSAVAGGVIVGALMFVNNLSGV